MDNAAILIIALSARPYVEAAKQAGLQVTAIDGFADMLTQALADETTTVPFDEHGFKADELLEVIQSLDASSYKGFVYGSGFDGQPDLLQKIAIRIPIIGNSVATVSAIKSSSTFFKALQTLNIPHPKVFDAIPDVGHYLKKSAGGCGGSHISIASPQDELCADQYFQQYIQGRSVSLLFLANVDSIEVIGFNEQWLNSSSKMPFRYGGAVGNVDLPKAIQQQLIEAAEKLTLEFCLVGLNSLDAAVEGNKAYVLEVNPRLSATFDLYDADLFNRHLHSCLRQAIFRKPLKTKLSDNLLPKAHAIVYATENVTIPLLFAWPGWVTDTPVIQLESFSIKRDEPICTVLACADAADTAKQLVQARVKMLLEMFKENT